MISSYLHENFQHYHLFVVSAAALSLFALFGMARYRVAWYFSISAPGAFLIPLTAADVISGSWPHWGDGLILALATITMSVWLLPIYWVAPQTSSLC
jgi:hypothetical protein